MLPRGARLPGSPEINANVGLEYRFAVGDHETFVRADSIYVSEFYSACRRRLNAGGQITSSSMPVCESCCATSNELFARNLTNEDGIQYREK